MLPLLIPLVTTLAPQVLSWLFGPKAGAATAAVASAVTQITGADPATAAGAAAARRVVDEDAGKAVALQQALAQIGAQMQAEADREADAARQAGIDQLKTLLAGDQAQAQVNAAEAAGKSLFVAGWRPAVGWTCAAGIAWAFVVAPLAGWASGRGVPAIDTADLLVLLQGMLGLGVMRTVEKIKGAAPNAH